MSPRLRARLGELTDRYTRWVGLRHRQVIGAGMALAVCGAALAITLPLRTEFSWLLPDRQPSVVALRELTARKPSSAVIEVGVASPDPAATSRFAHDLAIALRRDLPPGLLRGVDEDDSELRRFAWAHRHLYASEDELARVRQALEDRVHREEAKVNPLAFDLDDEPSRAAADPALDDLQRKLDDAKRRSEENGFVGEAGRLQMVVVRAPFGDTEPEKGKALLDALDQVVRKLAPSRYHPALEVGYAGDPVSAAHEHDLVVRDVGVSAGLCLVLVIAALLGAFRAPRAVFALALSLGVGCALTFGVTRLWVGHLNSSTAFLGSVVAGNGINFGIILLARYLEERRAGASHESALRTAMAQTASPTLVAAAAAGTSYLSLTITSFRGFSEFGIIAGTGMVLCWAASYTMLPALLTALERSRPLALRDPRPALSLAPLLRVWGWRVAPLGAVLISTGVGIYGAVKLSRDPFEDDLRTLRSRSYPSSAAGRWSARLDAAFGRDQSGGFYLGAQAPEDVPVLVAAIRASEHGVPDGDRLFGKIDALPELLPGTAAEQARKIALLERIRALADKIDPQLEPGSPEARRLAELRPPEGLRALAAADLPPSLRRAFTENDGRLGLLVAVHPGAGYVNWSHRVMKRAVELLRGLPIDPSILGRTQVSGPEMIFVDMMAAVRSDGPPATALSLLLVMVLLAAAFGIGRDFGVTLFALFAGVFGMLGLMALLHVRLNFLSFIAVPITLGIGVDYPFNVTARLRQERRAGAFGGQRWGRSLLQTGSAVALCSLTTIIGYATLLTSDTGAIRSFGGAAVLGEITCIVTGVVSVPCLLALLHRRGAGGGEDTGGEGDGEDAEAGASSEPGQARPVSRASQG